MDSLKSLFNKKQYNLIIELTKDVNSDYDALIYRINSFIALEEYKNALKTLENQSARNLLYNAAPLKFMKLHLGLLLHEHEFIKALNYFKEYQEKPYISQEVEEFLKETPDTINKAMQNEFSKNKNDSEEEILKILNNSNNNEVLIATIYKLRKLDISPYIFSLKSLIKKDHIRDDVKTLILLTLKDKKCDFDVSFKKNNKDYVVNPINLFTPFIGNEYEQVLKYIYQFSKDPSIENIAKDILSQYILLIYPDNILDLDSKTLASSLILIANKYLKIDDKNPKFIETYKLNFNDINDLSKLIIKRIEIK